MKSITDSDFGYLESLVDLLSKYAENGDIELWEVMQAMQEKMTEMRAYNGIHDDVPYNVSKIGYGE